MAYNFIGLVNDLNRRLNEVELSDTNFATAQGYYNLSKDAVNAAMRHIHQEEFEWPWNHREGSEVLTAGEVRYSIPYNAKTVNMNTFRIRRDASLNVGTHKLTVSTYEDFLDKHADFEYNSDASNRSRPTHVARTPSNELIIYPAPDKAYEVIYDYYSIGVDMEKADDVPPIPEAYRHVIVDGAMYYAYMFRGDAQAANMSQGKFEQGIKHMRSLHINRTDYIRDTRVYY